MSLQASFLTSPERTLPPPAVARAACRTKNNNCSMSCCHARCLSQAAISSCHSSCDGGTTPFHTRPLSAHQPNPHSSQLQRSIKRPVSQCCSDQRQMWPPQFQIHVFSSSDHWYWVDFPLPMSQQRGTKENKKRNLLQTPAYISEQCQHRNPTYHNGQCDAHAGRQSYLVFGHLSSTSAAIAIHLAHRHTPNHI